MKLYTLNTDTDLLTFMRGIVLDEYALFDDIYNHPEYDEQTIAEFNDLPTNEGAE